jgi:hypothetical protein
VRGLFDNPKRDLLPGFFTRVRVPIGLDLGARSALNAFSALREWNLALIGSTTPESMSKPVNHPERGDMTFRVLVETMAGHDLNHLKQIDRTLGASA